MGIEVVPKVTGADDFSFFQRLIPGVNQGFTVLGVANAAGGDTTGVALQSLSESRWGS